jgi:hypothetical protein
VGAVIAASAWAAPPAAADGMDADARVPDWDTAAATLGTAGSLWEPRWQAGLRQEGRIRVVADNLAFANGAVTAGDTAAAARYGRGDRSFRIAEKWADTGWAAEPVFTTSTAKVETVALRLGLPGMRTTVRATVYADCVEQPTDADPQPIPRGFRCSRADVLRTGGYLVMTARPASTMTAPGNTSVVISTTGLRFGELLRIARNLQQVAGAPTVAGSAQMVGMCRQMTSGPMTVAEATAFAQTGGYTARVGSVDGMSLPVTADYRPDRFTLAVVGGMQGTVTGCTYG